MIVWCVFKHSYETVYPLYIEKFRQDLCEYGQVCPWCLGIIPMIGES